MKENVEMGFSIKDADAGWVFEDIIDYGEFGNAMCHIGHPIRYGYIVINPQNPEEQHIYGSDCICKFWIAMEYKEINSEKFTELYTKYHPLFMRFAKLLYQLRKYGIQVPQFPQNLAELETRVAEMKDHFRGEIRRRRTEWKKALQEYEKQILVKRQKKEFLEQNPVFVTFIENQEYIEEKLQHSPFLFKFALDMVEKFERYGNLQLSEKQWSIIRQINDQMRSGNPELAEKIKQLIPTITNNWLKTNFLPSLVRQLEYKANLSEKQLEILRNYNIEI